MENYRLYKLTNYTDGKKENGIPTAPSTNGDIKKLVKSLESDHGYHEYFTNNKLYKMFFDLDHIKPDQVLKMMNDQYQDVEVPVIDYFINYLSDYKFFRGREIYHTKSIKDNELSYHIVIPSYIATIEQMKIIVSDLLKSDMTYNMGQEAKPRLDNILDLAVYREGFFRCPNQTVKGDKPKPYPHIIQTGSIEDFILSNPNIEENEISEVEPPTKINYTNQTTTTLSNDDINLLKFIKIDRFNDYSSWSKMGFIFKSFGISFDLFHDFSRQAEKYGGELDCRKFWDKIKPQLLPINVFYLIIKQDAPEEFSKITGRYLHKEEEKPELINIEKRYLTEDNVMSEHLETFFKTDIKSLSIKSPYDTGKTTLLKSVFENYKEQTKRVLWISYRRTLTYDLISVLGKVGVNFSNYLDNKLESDKLMIQVESVLKLENLTNLWDDDSNIPIYDLVVIDEVESVLMQFNSKETIKGKDKRIFGFLSFIIENSKKILVLDGDVGNRTYNYLNSFGKSLNINNIQIVNPKKYIFTKNTKFFNDKVIEDIRNGLKIVIVSSKADDKLHDQIFEEFSETKKIKKYTGSTSDLEKEDLKNVLTSWAELDVLIYSPTIEAGVSFDTDWFDKIYGIVCAKSTTPRGFSQMLHRIRKIKDQTIYIRNDSFNLKKQIYYYNFWEVKQLVLSLEDEVLKVDYEEVNGKWRRVFNKLSSYHINYIYNKLESLNAGTYYYLNTLKDLLIRKGSSVENLEDATIEKKEKREFKFLKSELIDEDIYKKLLKKQMKAEATAEEKQQIKHHYYGLLCGVDMPNEQLVKTFNKSNIQNFMSMIDINNINSLQSKDATATGKKEQIKKAQLLKSVINQLGFKNIYDTKEIKKDEFEISLNSIIKNNELFTNIKQTKTLFELEKNKKVENTKQFLGLFNVLVYNYHLKISSKQKTINKEKVLFYKLDILNNVDEIVSYKIKRGFKIVDGDKVFPEVINSKVYWDCLIHDQQIQNQDNKIVINSSLSDEDLERLEVSIKNLDKNIIVEVEEEL